MGAIAIPGFAFILGLWLWWHRDAPRFTVLLFLVAGIGLGGLLGQLVGGTLTSLLGAAGTATAVWIGVGASTVIAALGFIAFLEILTKGLGIKLGKKGGGAGGGHGGGGRGGGSTRRWHAWLALALPTVVIVAGVPILSLIMGAFSTGMTSIGASLSQIGG